MKIETLRQNHQLNREATLAEIAKLRAMTDNKYIQRGLDLTKDRLLKKWGEKRLRKEIPEKSSERFHAEQAPTLNGKNRGMSWTHEDELLVLETDEKDQELAIKLGRTTKAIRHKRAKLRAVETTACTMKRHKQTAR